MATATQQQNVHILSPRRMKVRASVIVGFVYLRSAIATGFLLKSFLTRINGAPCLRERKGQIPGLPFFMMAKLKWIWFRGIWSTTPEGHEAGIDGKFKRHIAAVEDYVASHYKEVTEETPIPEYDWQNGSPEDFYQKFVKTPHPVVLRGFALQTDAVKKWTFDYIVDKCGDVEVNLTDAEHDYPGKLKEVRDPRVYCANADAPFKAFPELSEELNIPRLEPYVKRVHNWDQMFIGQNSTGSGYHCAGIWNFFVMADGKKKWTFVDPEFSWMIYPSMATGALAYASLVSFPERADLAHYSLYRYCPRLWVELNPGDVLFNPPWWWHCVNNLTPTSVAVATRWDAVRGDFSFYEINRILSAIAVFNPLFGKFLFNFARTNLGHGRHLIQAGGGAFEENDMEEDRKNQRAREANSYHGNIVKRIRAKKKW